MTFLRLPSTLRWVLVASFIMLIVMTLYRLVLILVFDAETTQEVMIMLAGLVQDAGIVSIIGMGALALGWIPGCHPYKSKRGKAVLLSYFSLTAMLLSIIYIFDLIFLRSLDARVSSDVFLLFSDGSKKAILLIKRNLNIVPILLVVVFVGWMWWLLLSWLLNFLGMMDRSRQKSVRIRWQGITVSVFTIFIITSLVSPRDVTKKDLNMEKIGTRALIWNPVQTLTEH
jgi:hypothetical protein